MNSNKSIISLYMPFMHKCWCEGLSDTLISTIVPLDNSCISKYRVSEGFAANRTNLSKHSIAKLFEILKDFKWALEAANPVRTANNVKFWNKHGVLWEYFMTLRDKMLSSDEPNEEYEDAVALNNDYTEEELTEIEDPHVDDKPEPKLEFEPVRLNMGDIAYDIKSQLKEVCFKAINYEFYDIARDLLGILEDDFDNECQKS